MLVGHRSLPRAKERLRLLALLPFLITHRLGMLFILLLILSGLPGVLSLAGKLEWAPFPLNYQTLQVIGVDGVLFLPLQTHSRRLRKARRV